MSGRDMDIGIPTKENLKANVDILNLATLISAVQETTQQLEVATLELRKTRKGMDVALLGIDTDETGEA